MCKLERGSFLVSIKKALSSSERRSAVKNALIEWYMRQADKKIRERIPLYAAKLGVRPESIEIKNQRAQWGSCSRSGTVRFNWKIAMAPAAIMDYVIIHELCHLIHSNHQSQFWSKVQSVIPDYKIRKEWLKERSIIINVLN
jgi:predicted metal-dependent hydrolase